MRPYCLGLFLAATIGAAHLAAQSCEQDVPIHLDWCSADHGFNEGATCGLQALSKTSMNGLPPLVAQPILGNVWDRTSMMGAAKTAWTAGFKDQAVDAAICCQLHNEAAHSCLLSRRDLVNNWFDSHR